MNGSWLVDGKRQLTFVCLVFGNSCKEQQSGPDEIKFFMSITESDTAQGPWSTELAETAVGVVKCVVLNRTIKLSNKDNF